MINWLSFWFSKLQYLLFWPIQQNHCCILIFKETNIKWLLESCWFVWYVWEWELCDQVAIWRMQSVIQTFPHNWLMWLLFYRFQKEQWRRSLLPIRLKNCAGVIWLPSLFYNPHRCSCVVDKLIQFNFISCQNSRIVTITGVVVGTILELYCPLLETGNFKQKCFVQFQNVCWLLSNIFITQVFVFLD